MFFESRESRDCEQMISNCDEEDQSRSQFEMGYVTIEWLSSASDIDRARH